MEVGPPPDFPLHLIRRVLVYRCWRENKMIQKKMRIGRNCAGEGCGVCRGFERSDFGQPGVGSYQFGGGFGNPSVAIVGEFYVVPAGAMLNQVKLGAFVKGFFEARRRIFPVGLVCGDLLGGDNA